MENILSSPITVAVVVKTPLAETWEMWTNPSDIIGWYFASDDWHSPKAENDLRTGGAFLTRMEAKDGSFGFDFYGIYNQIVPFRLIEITLGDDRKVKIHFEETAEGTRVTEIFEAETTNSLELQQGGWQAILNNFKKYAAARLQK